VLTAGRAPGHAEGWEWSAASRWFAGNWWAGVLTWLAFGRRRPRRSPSSRRAVIRRPGSPPAPPFDEIRACRTGSRNSPAGSIRWSGPPRRDAPRNSRTRRLSDDIQVGLINSRNSIRVDFPGADTPSIAEVTAFGVCSHTPRIIMHR